jgi:hypothetical protein
MRACIPYLLALLSPCLGPPISTAQQTVPDILNRHVRVWVEGAGYTGTVVQISAYRLQIDRPDWVRSLDLQWSEIDSLQVRAGHGRRWLSAVVLGLAIGVPTAWLACEANRCFNPLGRGCNKDCDTAAYGWGLAIGGGIGVLVGGRANERWTPVVDLPAGKGPAGLVLGLRVSWPDLR